MSDATPQNALVGLCEKCWHVRELVSGKGSRFFYCQRAATDERYAKYPRLPVVHCAGYEEKEPSLSSE